MMRITVMVIEDEPLLLKAITQKLRLQEMNVVSCVGGTEAISYLQKDAKLPDVIWLDYYLKDMNGLEFMKELKKNPNWATIPVVVISNSASPDKVKQMEFLGVKKYVLKAEHRLDELIPIIKSVVVKKGE